MSSATCRGPPPQRYLCSRLKRRRGEDNAHVRLRLTALSGGTWSPTRRAARGLASSSSCRFCGLCDSDLVHQLWTCEATKKARVELGYHALAEQGRAAGFHPRVTWECGIPLVPEILQSPAMLSPLTAVTTQGRQGGQWAFTDGSPLDPEAAETARGGWAVVCGPFEDFGPLPGWLQTINRAELWALIQAASRRPPLAL